VARYLQRPPQTVIAAACAAAFFTLLVSLLPPIHFAYRSPTAHATIETAASLIAAFGAVIFAGRFQRSRECRDLLLGAALALLAVSNLLFSLLPSLSDSRLGSFTIWSSLGGRTAGALALAAAAFLPDLLLARPRRPLAWASVAVAGTIAAVAIAVALLGDGLPIADPSVSPEDSGRPDIAGPAGLVATYAVLTALYAAAAIGFTRGATRRDDDLTTWLAAAAAVGAFAQLNYFLFPSISSHWIYTGDVLRLAFYLLLLTGALRAVVAYQRQAAAVYEERRRMARDLHDGIAQDLAFIASQSLRLADEHRPEVATLISEAANRALEESRVVLLALARPADESLRDALAATVSDLARRRGATVVFDIDVDAEAGAATRDALMRIACEAVNNSTRHGGARTVHIALENSNGLRMVVTDDGRGFRPDGAAATGGFGVSSMRERAEALGGELRVDSAPGRGATVEVRLP
jgi:signal transduction histidine kinase